MIVHVALAALTAALGLTAGWRMGRQDAWNHGLRAGWDSGLKTGWNIGWDSAVRTAKEKVGGES